MSFSMEKMLKAFQEIQEESDNRERSVINKNTSEQRSEQRTAPWEDLNEEDWELFMIEVSDTWECEKYKEKNMRDYSEVEMEVWERWQITGK